MEKPMSTEKKIEVERTFPTWTVTVNGSARFTGIWRRKSAARLAEGVAR